MVNITEPQIKKFTNEFIRPMSDRLVGTQALITIETVTWIDTISVILSGYADGDVVLDGSLTDGRTPLTKKDIVDFITVLAALDSVFSAIGNTAILSKPHVNIRMP